MGIHTYSETQLQRCYLTFQAVSTMRICKGVRVISISLNMCCVGLRQAKGKHSFLYALDVNMTLIFLPFVAVLRSDMNISIY